MRLYKNDMKKINFCLLGLFTAIILSGCVSVKKYDLSLKNTLSIFMLNNDGNSFFCIPVQYMGDYHIGSFEFKSGKILIGDYEIALKREEINISVYLKEEADEYGSSDSGFIHVYSEEKGKILLSKMSEPLTIKQVEDDGKFTHYYIFIERFLEDGELKKINSEYEKGNVSSRLEIWYDLVIDNEPQIGNGMLDDFEIYDGQIMDPAWFPPNLNFFKAKYLR